MIIKIHNVLSWVVITVLLLCWLYFFISKTKKNNYGLKEEIINRIAVGITHLQIMMGVIAATHSNNVSFTLTHPKHIFFTYIHPTLMLIGAVFVTLSLLLSRKKINNSEKIETAHRHLTLGLGVLLISFALTLVV